MEQGITNVQVRSVYLLERAMGGAKKRVVRNFIIHRCLPDRVVPAGLFVIVPSTQTRESPRNGKSQQPKHKYARRHDCKNIFATDRKQRQSYK